MLAQIQFDWTINIGLLLHLVMLIISMTVLYMKMSHRMINTERRVETLYKWTRLLLRAEPSITAADIAAATDGVKDAP